MPEVGEPASGHVLEAGRRSRWLRYNSVIMWTKMMGGPRKKAPKTIAVIDPDRCFGAFACSICQAACPVADCIVEEPDRDGRMVCAVRADLCIGCGLCVTLGNPTAPQQREFGCPPDYDAINMMPFEEVVKMLRTSSGKAEQSPGRLESAVFALRRLRVTRWQRVIEASPMNADASRQRVSDTPVSMPNPSSI